MKKALGRERMKTNYFMKIMWQYQSPCKMLKQKNLTGLHLLCFKYVNFLNILLIQLNISKILKYKSV